MTTLRGLVEASHPFPLAMVLLLTLLIAVATAGGAPDLGRLALVAVAILLSQLSIGWSNDYLDRHADAQVRPEKPVPSGRIDARLLPPATVAVLAVAGVAGALLGVTPLLLLVAGTACGLAYNLGLKSTPLSAAPFLIAFTLLPLYVWTALDLYESDLLALYPIGLSLPVAVHVANVLPDIDADRAQGRRTLAVQLGPKRSRALVIVLMTIPLALTAISLAWLTYTMEVLVATAVAFVALTAGIARLYRQPDRRNEVWAFRVVGLASLVFAAGWLAAR